MGIRQIRPVNASSRFQTFPDFVEVTADRPLKSLTKGKKSSGGRNNRGHQTSWFRGGGHKRRYREIDFRRDKHGVPGKVASIEYDPNRSSRIALVHYADGEKRYILAPQGLQVGMEIVSGEGSARQLFLQVMRSAKEELAVFDAPPYATEPSEGMKEQSARMSTGSLRLRTVFDSSLLEDPVHVRRILAGVAAGE